MEGMRLQTNQVNRALKDQEIAMRNITKSSGEINREVDQITKLYQEYSQRLESLLAALPDVRRTNVENERTSLELLQLVNGSR
jgi:methyl-accepting chemotaxis protein